MLPTWMNTFNSDLKFGWGNMENVRKAAAKAKYEFFTWNGNVWTVPVMEHHLLDSTIHATSYSIEQVDAFTIMEILKR